MLYFSLIAVFISFLLCSYSYAGMFFTCNEMDYFSTEKACQPKNKQATGNKPASRDNSKEQGSARQEFTPEQLELWAEPTMDESGRIVSKLPPLPALKVLVNPTEQTAKEYIEWNEKRMKALQNAQNLIKKASGIDQLPGASVIDDIKKVKNVSFFFSPTCPYCEQQVPALESLAKRIGYSKFRAYPTTYDISKLNDFIIKTKMRIKVYKDQKAVADNKVTSVPVTIVTMTDGRKLRFDGLTESFTEKPINPADLPISPEYQQLPAFAGQQQANQLSAVKQAGGGNSCPQ